MNNDIIEAIRTIKELTGKNTDIRTKSIETHISRSGSTHYIKFLTVSKYGYIIDISRHIFTIYKGHKPTATEDEFIYNNGVRAVGGGMNMSFKILYDCNYNVIKIEDQARNHKNYYHILFDCNY